MFVAWDTQEVESPLHNRTRSPIDQDNQGEGNRRSDDDATDTLEHPLESIHVEVDCNGALRVHNTGDNIQAARVDSLVVADPPAQRAAPRMRPARACSCRVVVVKNAVNQNNSCC